MRTRLYTIRYSKQPVRHTMYIYVLFNHLCVKEKTHTYTFTPYYFPATKTRKERKKREKAFVYACTHDMMRVEPSQSASPLPQTVIVWEDILRERTRIRSIQSVFFSSSLFYFTPTQRQQQRGKKSYTRRLTVYNASLFCLRHKVHS